MKENNNYISKHTYNKNQKTSYNETDSNNNDLESVRYSLFLDLIKNEVRSILGDFYNVSINHVTKNNGLELDGIVICEKKELIAPNVYLHNFYNRYRDGENIHILAKDIISICSNTDSSLIKCINNNLNPAYVKDRIVFRIVNYKKNQLMLKNMPYIRLLDLAVIFYYTVECSSNGLASIRITNDFCEKWNISIDDLRKYATINTPQLFPGQILNMKDVIKDLMKKNNHNFLDLDYPDSFNEDSSVYEFGNNFGGKVLKDYEIDIMIDKITEMSKNDMFIITNSISINGASAILYNGLLKKFANKLDSDLYLLPSSIHEMIILAVSDDLPQDELESMVREVNAQIPVEDVLSDKVYIYHRSTDTITI